MNKLILSLIIVFIMSLPAFARDVVLDEKIPVTIEISMSDLNLLKFPGEGFKVYTSNANIQFQIEGKNCFVLYKGTTPEVVSAFLVGGDLSYPLLFIPKKVPATTHNLTITEFYVDNSIETETLLQGSEYVSHLRDIIRGLYLRAPLGGYQQRDTQKDTTRWKGTSQMMIVQQKGAFYTGEVHIIKNLTNETLLLSPNIFWAPTVLAVSIVERELKPNEITEVMIVKRNEIGRSRQEINVYDRVKR